ncbi:hypothetical protein WKT22_03700 [Candidatus Lokiarchaeum ossiferum]
MPLFSWLEKLIWKIQFLIEGRIIQKKRKKLYAAMESWRV